MRKTTTLYLTLPGFILCLALSSCEEQTGTHTNAPAIDSSGVSSSGTMSIEGQIVSVPSPTQLAVMIQKANVPFDASLVNPLANRDKYLSETQKAMNLGVYGADLAYIANYNSGQLNNDYFDAVGKLSADLQILDHIDQRLVTSLNNHIGNRDSLLRLNARFFKAGDNYLKESKRSDLAALILFGGWIEALHISVQAAKGNQDIRQRVGEQKHATRSLNNLLQMINDPAISSVKEKMQSLMNEFDALTSTYVYQKPINDAKEKTTYLRGRTGVEVSDEQLAEIEIIVEQLRNLIIL